MANETEKDLNINIRNYIKELNTDNPDFMSTIGTKDPKDLHTNIKQQTGVDKEGNPIYTPIYGEGKRGAGIDINASEKIAAYFKESDFNSLIDYWNKSVSEAIRNCKSIIGHYDEDNLITKKNGDIILKDAANSFHPYNEYVSPWNNFTNQNYLDARTDENIDVLTNDKYLDYTQSYNRKVLNDMIKTEDSSDNSSQQLVSKLEIADISNTKKFKIYVQETNTGYSVASKCIGDIKDTEAPLDMWCYLGEYDYSQNNESEELAQLSRDEKNNLYILRVLSDSNAKHVELFFEKQVVLKRKIQFGNNNTTITITGNTITEHDNESNSNITVTEDNISYSLLNSRRFTSNGDNVAGYDGISWEIKPGNQVGNKTVNDKVIECYSPILSIGKTYKNYSIILAALTNLIMPQYRRRVEIEDLNRNFWVISQNLTILNKFMIGLQDGIGQIFQDIFSEIIGLWDNIYSIWKSIFYLDSKINNFDKELNEIGVATSKVKVKIGYENTFYHEGWDSNQELIKKLFLFNDNWEPVDEEGNVLTDTLMIRNENYYFKKGDAKFFGIYPLLYKDTIIYNYKTNETGDTNLQEKASIISLPINSTIHPERLQALKDNNKNSEYIGNESEVINNIFMDGIGANGLQYNQKYNDTKLGELVRIERKFGNITAEEVLEKVRSKNFVLLGYYLKGENSAIDSLSVVINPFITLLQYMLDMIKKIGVPIVDDTSSTTVSAVKMALLANKNFKFGASIINNTTELPDNVLNSYKFLKELKVIDVSDGGTLFAAFETIKISTTGAEVNIDISNRELIECFWKVFYKIYKYVYLMLYNDGNETSGSGEDLVYPFEQFIEYQIETNDHISFLPFTSYIKNSESYNITYNDVTYDTTVVNTYNTILESFISSDENLQDNGNSAYCPIYTLFKNMREYFDPDLHNSYFYYTKANADGTSTTKGYKVVFPHSLLKDLGIITFNTDIDSGITDDVTINTGEIVDDTVVEDTTPLQLQYFNEVFKNFKKIKWDLLSADIIPDHFLNDSIQSSRTKYSATYDCSAYSKDGSEAIIAIAKAAWEKMDQSAFFNEGEKGYFGTSHLYPWKNCFGLWFEFVGEPTNTGRPIIDAEIQTYTHNMCQGNRIITYPDFIMNTGIILSQYNTYNLDITVPLMGVKNYAFHDILRFGKPYPNISSMLYKKLDSKYNNSLIYDHIKELNDPNNYYYCKYPFLNNANGIKLDSEIASRPTGSAIIGEDIPDLKYDSLLYPVDGYYGHETAGQSYGQPKERLSNYIYQLIIVDKMLTITRGRWWPGSRYYNNYFGYTYKDCQKYTLSSTDLVNAYNQDSSLANGGRTLWNNINMEQQLIANISFLNSSSYNQHIGLYVSKDTTNNDYAIPLEEKEEGPIINIPSEEPPGEVELTIGRDYSGNEWCMPPKFQDYFEMSNRADVYEIFTCEKLGDLQLKWHSGTKIIRFLDDINNGSITSVNGKITLTPRYIGTKPLGESGYRIDVYHFTIEEGTNTYKFLATRINHKNDKNTSYPEYPIAANYPSTIFKNIFNRGEDNTITLTDQKLYSGSRTTIANVDIWKGRIDFFCWFNHYTVTTVNKKSNERIAYEVLNGTYGWGVGQDRINRLQAAGYDPGVIQDIVNNMKVNATYKQEIINKAKEENNNGSKCVFNLNNNNFNILGEVEEDYAKETTTYTLKLPEIDFDKTPIGTTENSNNEYKNYYRTYKHYLAEIGDNGESYAVKNNLYLNLREYDNIKDIKQCLNDTYGATETDKNLVPTFKDKESKAARPFSNRMCGWDVVKTQ